MFRSVRKFLKNKSPDWLNTEVNKDLLQNLSANIKSSQPPASQTTHESQHINVLPSPRRSGQTPRRRKTQGNADQDRGAGGEVKHELAGKAIATSQKTISPSPPHPCTPATNTITSKLEFPAPGTPHWRRIKQVFMTLDNAPANYTYNQLIEYVREATGKGCSRKLISKWKKQKLNQKFPDNNSGDRYIEERTAAIPLSPAIVDFSSTVNCLQLTDSNSLSTDLSVTRPDGTNGDNYSLMTVKAWSYLAAAGIAVSLVGCELIPLKNNRPSENIAIASVTAPITPLTPIPERRKNRLEPRNIKIELTLSNPQDLKVKPGDKISAGQVLSDRVDQRNRLQAKKKQLQLSLEKLNLPLTPIAQPKPIPEIAELPPVSYAEEEAAIKLKQQKLIEANRAIAIQQKKIDSLIQLQASPSHRAKKEGNLKLVIEHEQANLKNLEAARESAQIQLEVQESKLTTAKEQRAYIEYQRQLEQTRRAIAIEQRNQAIASQKSERERLLAEREYSKAQIETQIQALDYQIHQLSTVTAPYEGTIKKVKWTGQSDHNLTAVVTLSVTSQQSAVSSDNSEKKPISDTQAKQTTKTQP